MYIPRACVVAFRQATTALSESEVEVELQVPRSAPI